MELANYEKLPRGEQFDWAWWYAGKYLRLKREYRKFCPDGRFLYQLRAMWVLGLACLLVTGWGFGFFGK